jgi:hypothetical protein
LKISLEIDGDLRVLPPTAASHVYRIVQELACAMTSIGPTSAKTSSVPALALPGSRSTRCGDGARVGCGMRFSVDMIAGSGLRDGDANINYAQVSMSASPASFCFQTI